MTLSTTDAIAFYPEDAASRLLTFYYEMEVALRSGETPTDDDNWNRTMYNRLNSTPTWNLSCWMDTMSVEKNGWDGIPLSLVHSLSRALLVEICRDKVPGEEIDKLLDLAIYSPEDMSSRYTVFKIPKKSGGVRVIEAPDETLKTIQRLVLHHWWYAFGGLRKCVQGFVPKRGIKTNAERHFDGPDKARRLVLLKMDLRDFFTSISAVGFYNQVLSTMQRRVYKEFFKIPPALVRAAKNNKSLFDDVKGPAKADWFYHVNHTAMSDKTMYDYIAMLPDNGVLPDNADLRGAAYGLFMTAMWGVISICSLDGRLPQGSPCSPAMTNIFMENFNSAVLGCARNVSVQEGTPVTYSIYGDDSCTTSDSLTAVLRMKGVLSSLIRRYPDISQNEKKTGIFKCGQTQTITGICVTDRVSISRNTRDKVRAELHNVVEGKKKLTPADIMRLKGMRAHIIGIDPDGWNRRCDALFKAAIG